MKNSLNSILKGALLATTAAVAVTSAQAQTPNYVSLAGTYQQGDLLAGFTTGSGNDLIVNLGLASSVLVNGNAWNLTAALAQNGTVLVEGVVELNLGPHSHSLLELAKQ